MAVLLKRTSLNLLMACMVVMLSGCGSGTREQQPSGPPQENYSAEEDPALKDTESYEP